MWWFLATAGSENQTLSLFTYTRAFTAAAPSRGRCAKEVCLSEITQSKGDKSRMHLSGPITTQNVGQRFQIQSTWT
jgi:hypothetical protein